MGRTLGDDDTELLILLEESDPGPKDYFYYYFMNIFLTIQTLFTSDDPLVQHYVMQMVKDQ